VVQERRGHSSIAITMDINSHAMPNMQHDAVALVGDALLSAREHAARKTMGSKAVANRYLEPAGKIEKRQ
jgi:hypothetical protein